MEKTTCPTDQETRTSKLQIEKIKITSPTEPKIK
jgi:hypothetical protein